MNVNWFKRAVQAFVGCGIGCAIGVQGIEYLIVKRRADNLESMNNDLIEANKTMQAECERLKRINENLREANRWITDVALKEAIVEEYDNTMDAVEAWAEESKQIVDEMSDEEYEETLAYIRSKKHD